MSKAMYWQGVIFPNGVADLSDLNPEGLTVPSGDTAARSEDSPNGTIRLNTDIGLAEIRENDEWNTIASVQDGSRTIGDSITWDGTRFTMTSLAPANRAITAGGGLTGGGTLVQDRTISVDVDGLTAETSPVIENDYVMMHKASVDGLRKVKVGHLGYDRNPIMDGAVLDGTTADDTALAITATAAITDLQDVRIGGRSIKLANRRNAIAGAKRIGQGSIVLPDDTVVPWEVKQRLTPMRYSFTDDTTTTAISDEARYEAFPMLTQLANGTMVAVWWEGDDHSPQQPSGGDLGDLVISLSKNGGKDWGIPFAIAGNLNGPDATFTYYYALGVDINGEAVLVFVLHNGVTQVRPWIIRSPDGEVWTEPVEITLTNDSYSDNRSILPFGSITCLPSGKLIVPVYAGDKNWAGIIDPSAPFEIDLSSTILDAADHSEFAICALSENHWLSVVRKDGTTNASPLYETTNSGTTWDYIGTTGLPISGGYVPQDLLMFTIGGRDHIGLLMGLRDSDSAPPDGAPGVGFFVALADQLRTPGDTVEFVRVHLWDLPGDDSNRDAYVGGFIDPDTQSLAIITHNETTGLLSNVRYGAASIGDMLGGQALSISEAWPTTMEIQGATTVGTQVYSTRTDRYSMRGNTCRIYLRFALTSGDFTGNMEVHNLPFEIGEDFEATVTTATNLANLIERVTVRGSAGDTYMTVLERQGTSGLTMAEINDGGTSDFRMEFDYVIAR